MRSQMWKDGRNKLGKFQVFLRDQVVYTACTPHHSVFQILTILFLRSMRWETVHIIWSGNRRSGSMALDELNNVDEKHTAPLLQHQHYFLFCRVSRGYRCSCCCSFSSFFLVFSCSPSDQMKDTSLLWNLLIIWQDCRLPGWLSKISKLVFGKFSLINKFIHSFIGLKWRKEDSECNNLWDFFCWTIKLWI